MLGCKDLTVATDHKPLLNILNDRSLADIQNRRLQNLKEKTLSYQFTIAHVPGRQHLGPDAASRYPVGDPERLVLPGEPPETDFEDHTLTSNLRAIILAGLCDDVSDKDDDFYEAEDMLGSLLTKAVDTLEGMELATVENDESSTVVSLYSASHVKNMVSWSDVKESTAKDATILSVLELLKVGFPEDIRKVAPDIRQYARYSSQLYELDGVLMLNDRIVIPAAIRKDILKLLHAAHQGVDRMKARASDAMYWPGMVGDITRTRAECTSCHQIAKSNPSQPPMPPADPEFPFQQIAADYFHHMGCYYAVIVDRYSH